MTAVSRPRCHASNGMRIRSSCAATLGHAVLTIPDGRIRCRATSDSFESELRVLGGDATMSAHPRLGRNSLKLLNLRRDIPELPRKRRQIARKNVLRVQVSRHHSTQRTQLFKTVAKRRRNIILGSVVALSVNLDRTLL